MSKSYVSMETRICIVCGKEYDTNSIIMDNKMRDKFEMRTCTGYGMCPEHQKIVDEGKTFLIEIENEEDETQDVIKTENAIRTGRIMITECEEKENYVPVAYISQKAFEALKGKEDVDS